MKSLKIIQIGKSKAKKIKKKIYENFKRENFDIKTIDGSKNNLLIPDLRKNLKLCLWLEAEFKQYIYKTFPKKYHKNLSLQFTMSIRLFINSPKKNTFHDYSTNSLHSDVWSGAPKNIRNFIYYVKISENSSFCKVFKSIKGIKKYESYRGKHLNAPVKEHDLKEIKYTKRDGVLLSFESFCPHYTFFPKNCNDIRISLDFRVKIGSPYYENNKVLSKKIFISNKIGQPGLGFYWTLSRKKFKNINDKVVEELKISKKISKNIFRLRNSYIKENKLLKSFL